MGLQGLWQPIAPDAAAPEEEAGLTSVLTAEIVDNELPSEVADETARCFELQSAVSHQGELRCIHRTAGDVINAAEVLDLVAEHPHVVASRSNGTADVYTVADDGKLQLVFSLRGSESAVDSTLLSRGKTGNLQALTVSVDGMREYSLHAPASVNLTAAHPKFAAGRQVDVFCAAISPSGTWVAAGGQGVLLLFDRATSKLVAAFDETHKEAVSQVVWAPGEAATLISASDDGLVIVFDFKDVVDEDDSWQAALNLEGAVARMGFYGSSGQKLWMVSQTAGLHLWAWRAACSEEETGGEGTLADFHDARPDLAAVCCHAEGGSSATTAPQAYDFLITCHFDQHSNCLILAAGCNDGNCTLFVVNEPSVALPASIGPAVAWMKGSHTDAVRGTVWMPNNLIATGGDDGSVCTWEPSPAHSITRKKRKLHS